MATSRNAADVANLFGAAPAKEVPEGGIEEGPVKKRIILEDSDDSESVAAVLFRPWEVHLRMLRKLRSNSRIRRCIRVTSRTHNLLVSLRPLPWT